LDAAVAGFLAGDTVRFTTGGFLGLEAGVPDIEKEPPSMSFLGVAGVLPGVAGAAKPGPTALTKI